MSPTPEEQAELQGLFLSAIKRLGVVTSELDLRGDEPAEKLQLGARRIRATRRDLLEVASTICAESVSTLNGHLVPVQLIAKLQAAVTAASFLDEPKTIPSKSARHERPNNPADQREVSGSVNDPLTPCPFCGETEKLSLEWEPMPPLDETDSNQCHFIECQACQSRGPWVDRNRTGAVDGWNKRKPNTEVRGAARRSSRLIG